MRHFLGTIELQNLYVYYKFEYSVDTYFFSKSIHKLTVIWFLVY